MDTAQYEPPALIEAGSLEELTLAKSTTVKDFATTSDFTYPAGFSFDFASV